MSPLARQLRYELREPTFLGPRKSLEVSGLDVLQDVALINTLYQLRTRTGCGSKNFGRGMGTRETFDYKQNISSAVAVIQRGKAVLVVQASPSCRRRR